jgi:hypothetical protein
MGLGRPLIAYLTAVGLLLGTAGFFLSQALAPLSNDKQASTQMPRPIPPKLQRSAERRAEDAALRRALAAKKERPAPVAVAETTGSATPSVAATDVTAKRAESAAVKQAKARAAALRASRAAALRESRQRALASERYRDAYGSMSYAPAQRYPQQRSYWQW